MKNIMHRPLLPLLLLSLVLQSCDRLGTLIPQGSRAYAEAITVRIATPNQGEDGGSGVLVERQGNRYTVLTNCHVLGFGAGTYTLWVAGGDPKSHCHGSVDLAKFTFETDKKYPVPTVRPLPLEELKGQSIQVAGYRNPEPYANDPKKLKPRSSRSGTDEVKEIDPDGEKGFQIIHDFKTYSGMSGGPVTDMKGRLLAINGLTNPEMGDKSTYAAIPIRFYTNWDSTPIASNPVNNPVTPPPTPPPTPIPPTPTPTPTFLGLPVEPYTYTSARVSATGDISPYEATGQRYTETALNLPAGAVPLEMVAIEGGTFMMGQTEAEKRQLIEDAGQDTYDEFFDDEVPRHQVTVPSFFMGQYEVTQAQYEAVMGTNPTEGKAWVWNGSEWTPNTQIPSKFLGANKPVVGVSWDDAQTFIDRLNDRTGQTYRLPTEAEWEYAARAGTTTPFSYGETITPDVVNYAGTVPYGDAPKGEYREVTIAVDSLYPNPWGLYHIHGNVWEWVEDGWHDNYNGAPTDGIAWLSSDERRGLRGGSWFDDARVTRSAYRFRDDRDVRGGNGGFRVVLVP